jgi:hypothetical protein
MDGVRPVDGDERVWSVSEEPGGPVGRLSGMGGTIYGTGVPTYLASGLRVCMCVCGTDVRDARDDGQADRIERKTW